jgi:UDP-N-acetyl-2-amino-2-deoxyglucuronate dehydrogenase
MSDRSSTSGSYGFGIVGVGMIADYHARAIAQVTGARLVGVASRNIENARAFAERHQAPVVTSGIEALAARPDIDVICVTTPSGAHLEPALAAIRAGKHVVVEKPIEITTERADQILDAADRAGVKVLPIFQSRYGEGSRTIKAALDAGRFGRIVLATAHVRWQRSAEYYTGWKGTLQLDGGGALINQGIHAIDLLQWFAGLPAEVSCFKTRRVHTGIEGEDTLAAALRFPSGALGTIEASTACWPGWDRRLEICGEFGSVRLENDHIAKWDFRDTRPGDDVIRAGEKAAAFGSGATKPDAMNFEGHRRQLQDLVDALRQNRPVAIDGHEARKALALVCALYASAERGTPVTL